MKRNKWYLVLIITSLIVLVSLSQRLYVNESRPKKRLPHLPPSQIPMTFLPPHLKQTLPPITVPATPPDGTQAGSDPVPGETKRLT